jgi:DNA repair ATPase RecN
VYQKLIDEIGEKRANSATFHRVDLHVHTCESEDYPRQTDKREKAPPLADQDRETDWSTYEAGFLAAARNATPPLSLIAITDHNKNRLASKISKACSDPVVLPGVELNIQCTEFQEETIHLVAIWDKGSGHELLDRVLHADDKLPAYDQRTVSCRSTTPIAAFIEGVHKKGGICIAAHVNSSSGAREYIRGESLALAERRKRIKELNERQAPTAEEEAQLSKLKQQQKAHENAIQERYLSIIANYNLDAVEIASPDERKHYEGYHTTELGMRAIPCVMSSDAHCLGDIGLPGSCTYLKMTHLGLRGVRDALADPQTRVRYDDQVSPSKYARIQGIRLVGAKGFFQNQVMGFSDNLTCLIGGRGTGKSALIDALRYAFKVPVEHLEDKQRNDVEDRQRATLQECEIDVLLKDADDNDLVLKARYSPDLDGSFQVLGVDGSVRPEVPGVSPKLRIELWGWGEIESATRSLEQQRVLLDRFTPQSAVAREAILAATRAVESNTREVVATVRSIVDLLPKISLLKEKEEELDRLDTPRMKEIYREFDAVEHTGAALGAVGAAIRDASQSFLTQQGDPHDIVATIDCQLREMRSSLTESGELPPWFDAFERALLRRSEKGQRRYQELVRVLNGMVRAVESLTKLLGSQRESVIQKLNEIQEGATEKQLRTDMGRRQTLASQVNDMRQTKREIDEKRARLSELLEQRWSELIPELDKARQKLFEVRETKAADISGRLKDLKAGLEVELSILHGADRTLFERRLGSPRWPREDGLLKGCGLHYRQRDLGHDRQAPHPNILCTGCVRITLC